MGSQLHTHKGCLWVIVWIGFMSAFSWQGQNLCWLSLAFIIDCRVVIVLDIIFLFIFFSEILDLPVCHSWPVQVSPHSWRGQLRHPALQASPAGEWTLRKGHHHQGWSSTLLQTGQLIKPKTPSFIPGQQCPQNLEISIITDVQFSNINNSEVVKDINELLSYSENLVF